MEVDPINQAEFNKDREKVNTFAHIYQRILNFRGVFSFTVMFNNKIWKTTMPSERADKLCHHWSGILDKLNRNLKDMDMDDAVISLQATTRHHELVIVQGLIKQDSNKKYTLAAHQWTPYCSVPESCKPMVQGKLSQLLKEKDYSRPADFKKLLWRDTEEPKVRMDEREHPVETEVLRRREEIPEVKPDTSLKEKDIVSRFMEGYITGSRWRQEYQRREDKYRGERAVWPSSLPAELRTTKDENPLSWFPDRTAEELEKLSLKSEKKKIQRKKIKKNKYGGALHVHHFLEKQRRKKEERKKRQKLTLDTLPY